MKKLLIVLDCEDYILEDLKKFDINEIELYPNTDTIHSYTWEDGFRLLEMPQKMNAREKDNMIVSIGWNLCLDEILNENNVYEIEIKDSKYQEQIDDVLGKDIVDKFFKGEE